MTDLNKHSQGEDLFRRNLEIYRELVHNTNSIILKMDTLGAVTFVNEFAQEFFGYRETELIGKNVIGTIVPELVMP